MNSRVSQLFLLSMVILAKAFPQTFTDGPSVVANADSRIEIFARASDGSVWHNWQTSPAGAWSGWSSLGGIIFGAPAATINADGRLEVFVLGGGNTIFHNYQSSPGGGWSGWIPLGGSISSAPTVATNFDGRLEVFAQGTDTAAWTLSQEIPGGGWGAWVSLGGIIAASPSVTQNANGELEIFGLGGTTVYHNVQTSPGAAWSGWNPIGCCIAQTPNVGINDDGRLELIAIGTDNAAWHAWQQTPGSNWSGFSSLGGIIQGTPSIELNANEALEIFATGSNAVYHNWQTSPGGGWNGWSPMGGIVQAAPSVGVNFDGRMEIFALGEDGNAYHSWELSAGGGWSGWAPITMPSDGAGTDTTFDPVFLTDAQNESNFASAKSGGYPPPWLSTLTAWPCGARVNIGITGYNKKDLKPFQDAVAYWNQGLFDYYSPTYSAPAVPVQLYISAGGPETLSVSRAPTDSLPPDPNNPKAHARAQTGSWQQFANGRLLSAATLIIRSMRNGATLTNAFAHELGHTFGLGECNTHPACGTTTYVNNLYKVWSYTVMDTSEPAPPGSNGWDDAAKNFTEGLPSPVRADLQVIDSHLPDYRQCALAESSPPSDVASCTDGSALGFSDVGPTSTYTCGGYACDGCNSSCSNFAPAACGASGGGGGGGGTPECSQWCGSLCMDGLTCGAGGQPTCQDEDEGPVPVCPNSPIVIDAFAEGFHLTDLSKGVKFRVLPNQTPSQMSWTDPQWRNGWLALDRDGNGTIDDFTELFGDLTAQPKSSDPNGYLALAIFDDPMNGGNGNGVIDPEDSVYEHLRLWIDANHDGISQPGELHSLRDVGIFRIDLQYALSSYVDSNGNHFRYKARIWDEAGHSHNACYDVFLSVQATPPSRGQ